MKVVIQRSKSSKVSVDGKIVGKIEYGLLLLTGFTHNDNEQMVDKVIEKIINLRIFEDENGLMNKSLLDIKGSILNISQFTLYANIKKGRRPSFVDAMEPNKAKSLYNYMNQKIKDLNIEVETGIFGADMKVDIYNDGPVTIILDTDNL